MKNLKKIMALMIAMVMVLGMSTSVFADPPVGPITFETPTPTRLGSITVKSNDSISVNDRSFTAYKLLDAVYSQDGLNVAYTIPGDEDGTLATFYNNYFSTTTTDNTDPENSVERVTSGKDNAAAAGITFDQYVAEQIEAMDTAEELQAFINAAQTAVTAPGVTDVEKVGPVAGANNQAKFSNLAPGYYLVADTTSEPIEPVSALMLDTVNNADVEIIIKANQPTPDKEVVTATANPVNNNGPAYTEGTNEANNVGIGDTVNYKLTENVPNWKGYDHFYFIINDTMSNGLTFNNDIKVTGWKKADATAVVAQDAEVMYVVDRDGDFYKKTVSGTDSYTENPDDAGVTDKATKYSRYVKQVLVEDEDYYVYLASENETDSNHTFEIAFANIKDFAVDSDIIVTYSANVNADAITDDANGNSATATFSNDPSKSERGDKVDQPGKPQNTTNHPVGETPASRTETYSTGLTITKYDATTGTDSRVVLPGVQFTLTGTKDVVTVTDQDYFTQDDNGEYYLLKDGTYTTEAPVTEASMNRIATTGDLPQEGQEFAGYVKDSEGTEVVGGENYRAFDSASDVNPGSGALLRDLYEKVNANTGDYTDINIKYSKTKASAVGKQPVHVKMVGTTDADGKLEFKNLSEGTYTLSETGTPDGFNSIADITFVIKWNNPTEDGFANNGKEIWEKDEDASVNADNIAYNSETGCFTVTIENKKGTELPETGGIGTTIFYVVGSLLVIGAGVLLITRKRMASH